MWRDKLNEIGKGKVTVDFLGGPEVIPPSDLGMAVRKGVVDGGFAFSTNYPGLVQDGGTMVCSRLTNEEERERGVWDLWRESHAKVGIYFLGRDRDHPGGYFLMWLNKKVETPKDLAGMKIGTLGPLSAPFMEALGVAHSTIDFPDFFTAVETGVVDGYYLGESLPVALGLHEVTKYRLNHRVHRTDLVYLFNMDFWNKLPQDVKDLIEEARMYAEVNGTETAEKMLAGYRQKEKDAGVEFITFSPEDAKYYRDLAYTSYWDYLLKQYPDWAPKYYEIMEK